MSYLMDVHVAKRRAGDRAKSRASLPSLHVKDEDLRLLLADVDEAEQLADLASLDESPIALAELELVVQTDAGTVGESGLGIVAGGHDLRTREREREPHVSEELKEGRRRRGAHDVDVGLARRGALERGLEGVRDIRRWSEEGGEQMQIGMDLSKRSAA